MVTTNRKEASGSSFAITKVRGTGRPVVRKSHSCRVKWTAHQDGLTDGGFIPREVERTVPNGSRGTPFWESLKEAKALLILDSCEHLLPKASEEVRKLLELGPGLQLLATSREPLKVPGEQLFALPALDERSGVELLLRRGREVSPALEPGEGVEEAFRSIHSELDGIPLALELAGARLGILSPQQLADRLTDRFRILKGGPTAEPRQMTLGAVLDWSFENLEEPLRELFCALSVFRGTFDLAAVEEVCLPGVADWEVLDRLSGLVEKSLVTALTVGGVRRFRLLKTTRQYAEEHLGAASRLKLSKSHLSYYYRLTGLARAALSGPEQLAWIAVLDREMPNIRAAVHGAEAGQTQTALEICLNLTRYWLICDLKTEMRTLMKSALERGEQVRLDPVLTLRSLRLLAELATDQGDLKEAEGYLKASLQLAREQEDDMGAAHGLRALGNLSYCEGEFEEAYSLYRQALKLFERCSSENGMAACRNNLGLMAFELGRYEEAGPLLQQSAEQALQVEDPHSYALSSTNLGHLALVRRDWEQADYYFQEALSRLEELQDRGNPLLQALKGMAEVYRATGRHSKFVETVQQATELARDCRIVELPSRRTELAKLQQLVALGEDRDP